MKRPSSATGAGRPSEEQALIARLRRLFAEVPGALVGIGDDAAVLGEIKGCLVSTVDTSVEHVHFERRLLSMRQLGRRSLHAAASDLAAMGAKPLAVLSSLIVTPADSRATLTELARGQRDAARELGMLVVGGNVARGGELSVTTTVLGTCRRPIRRSGACPGDAVWIHGTVGMAAAGLELLLAGKPTRSRAARACVRAWREPRALVDVGQRLRGVRALIDVSDGLAGDAGQLAAESQVRVVLSEAQLTAALSPELGQLGASRSPLELALYGGEDYALLGTGRRTPAGAIRIGTVEAGTGVVLLTASGGRTRLGRGYDHLAPR